MKWESLPPLWERTCRIAKALGMTPGVTTHLYRDTSGVWCLGGCRELPEDVPGTSEATTEKEALEAAEAYLGVDSEGGGT